MDVVSGLPAACVILILLLHARLGVVEIEELLGWCCWRPKYMVYMCASASGTPLGQLW